MIGISGEGQGGNGAASMNARRFDPAEPGQEHGGGSKRMAQNNKCVGPPPPFFV